MISAHHQASPSPSDLCPSKSSTPYDKPDHRGTGWPLCSGLLWALYTAQAGLISAVSPSFPQPLIQEAPSTENRTNLCARRVFLPHCRNLLESGRHKLDSWYHHVSRQTALLDLILSLTHAPTSLCKVYCFKKKFFLRVKIFMEKFLKFHR